MDPVRSKYVTASSTGGATKAADSPIEAAEAGATKSDTARSPGGRRPVVPAGIREKFLAVDGRIPDDFKLEYRPALSGKGKVHFVRKSDGVDVWQTCFLLQANKDTPPDDIWQGAATAEKALATEEQPDDRGRFLELPADLSRDKSYPIFLRQLKEHLYREEVLELWHCQSPNAIAKPGESEADFRARLAPLLPSELSSRKADVEKSYEKKLADANDKVLKAKTRVNARRWQFFSKLGSVVWVVVDTAMAAMGKNLPGRRRSIDPAIRSMATETGYSSNAKLDLERAQQNLEQLQQERDATLKQLEHNFTPAGLKLERLALRPQKGDVEADEVSLVWLPFHISPAGAAEPVYRTTETVSE
jgi:hypothetical protein